MTYRSPPRSPEKQAQDFMAANDRSPAIVGSAIEANPSKPSRGINYKLADGSWWRLGAKACRLLHPDYPKWKNV